MSQEGMPIVVTDLRCPRCRYPAPLHDPAAACCDENIHLPFAGKPVRKLVLTDDRRLNPPAGDAVNPKPNRYAFDIQAVIDTARKLGESDAHNEQYCYQVQELREKITALEASPERAENERLKEENRKLEAMVNGSRESDHALADKARQALLLRGWKRASDLDRIGSAVAELIAFLDHALPVAPAVDPLAVTDRAAYDRGAAALRQILDTPEPPR